MPSFGQPAPGTSPTPAPTGAAAGGMPAAPMGAAKPSMPGQFPSMLKAQKPAANPVAVKPPQFAQATPQGVHQAAQAAMKAGGDTFVSGVVGRFGVLYGIGGGEYGPDVASMFGKEGEDECGQAGNHGTSNNTGLSGFSGLFTPQSRPWGPMSKVAANGAMAAASMPPPPQPAGAQPPPPEQPMAPPGAPPMPPGGDPSMGGQPMPPGAMPPPMPGQPPPPPMPGAPGSNPREAIPDLATDLAAQGNDQKSTVGDMSRMENVGLQPQPSDQLDGQQSRVRPMGGSNNNPLGGPGSMNQKMAGLNIEIEDRWLKKLAVTLFPGSPSRLAVRPTHDREQSIVASAGDPKQTAIEGSSFGGAETGSTIGGLYGAAKGRQFAHQLFDKATGQTPQTATRGVKGLLDLITKNPRAGGAGRLAAAVGGAGMVGGLGSHLLGAFGSSHGRSAAQEAMPPMPTSGQSFKTGTDLTKEALSPELLLRASRSAVNAMPSAGFGRVSSFLGKARDNLQRQAGSRPRQDVRLPGQPVQATPTGQLPQVDRAGAAFSKVNSLQQGMAEKAQAAGQRMTPGNQLAQQAQAPNPLTSQPGAAPSAVQQRRAGPAPRAPVAQQTPPDIFKQGDDWLTKLAIFGNMGRALGRVGSGYKSVSVDKDSFIPKALAALPEQAPLYKQIQAVMQQRAQPYGPWGRSQFAGWNKLSSDKVAAVSPRELFGLGRWGKIDQDVLSKTYRKLSKSVHPDHNPGDESVVPKFHALTDAFNKLTGKESFHDAPLLSREGVINNKLPIALGGTYAGVGGAGAAYAATRKPPMPAPEPKLEQPEAIKTSMDNCYAHGCSKTADGGCSCKGECPSCNPRQKHASLISLEEVREVAAAHRAKMAAHNGDLKGPIAVSASGESKGLSFADAGPIRHGQDAWSDMSKYMKGHSDRKSQPNPFEGKHSFDKNAGIGSLLGKLVGKGSGAARPSVPGFRSGTAPAAPPMGGAAPVSVGTPTPHAVLTPGGAPRPMVPGFRVESTAPKPAGAPAPVPVDKSSQIAIGGESGMGAPSASALPAAGPRRVVSKNLPKTKMDQSVDNLHNWAFRGGPKTWAAGGLAGLGGLGAYSQAKAAADITQAYRKPAPPPPAAPPMLPMTPLVPPQAVQPPPAPPPMQPPPPPMPVKTAAPNWLQTLGNAASSGVSRLGDAVLGKGGRSVEDRFQKYLTSAKSRAESATQSRNAASDAVKSHSASAPDSMVPGENLSAFSGRLDAHNTMDGTLRQASRNALRTQIAATKQEAARRAKISRLAGKADASRATNLTRLEFGTAAGAGGGAAYHLWPSSQPPQTPPPEPMPKAASVSPNWLKTLGGGVQTTFPRQGNAGSLVGGTGKGIDLVSSSTSTSADDHHTHAPDGRHKVAGAAWRSPEALQAIAGRMGVSAPTRLGMLSRVKGGLGLNRSLPGVTAKMDSLPRTSHLPIEPGANATEPSTLYRGHRAPDPSIGNANYRDAGMVHASPNLDIAAEYGKTTVPGMGRFSQVSTYQPKPGQRYTNDFGLESRDPQAAFSDARRFGITPHETNVAGMSPDNRWLVPSGKKINAMGGDYRSGIAVPEGKGNDAFINHLMAPAPGQGPIGMTPKTAFDWLKFATVEAPDESQVVGAAFDFLKLAAGEGAVAKGLMGRMSNWLGGGAAKAAPPAGAIAKAPGWGSRAVGAIGSQAAPTAMGAATGAMTADSFGQNPWAGAAAGAAAFNPRLSRGAIRSGGAAATPVHALRGAIGGGGAGSAIDHAAGSFGYDTGGQFGRMGAYAGGGLGVMRGGGQFAANMGGKGTTLGATGREVANLGSRGQTGLQNFAQGTVDPILGGGRRALNWVSGGRMGAPAAASAAAPSVARRMGQVVGGAGLVGGAGSAVMGHLDDKFNQKANETFGAGLNALNEYADNKFDQFTQAAPAAIGRSAVQHVTDPIFQGLGMNPAGMHPAQKAMMLGGAGVGAYGLATGNPWAMGAGAAAAGGGAYMANHQNPLLGGYPQAQPPAQAPQPGQPQARNELAHQQQLQGQPAQPQPQPQAQGTTGHGWL